MQTLMQTKDHTRLFVTRHNAQLTMYREFVVYEGHSKGVVLYGKSSKMAKTANLYVGQVFKVNMFRYTGWWKRI